jgi:hypothetical protein
VLADGGTAALEAARALARTPIGRVAERSEARRA